MSPMTPQNTENGEKFHYSPPWAHTSIIGVAGASGSGKTSLAIEIVKALDLPWVIILSIDNFYKSLTPEQNALAHANEYDLDSPQSLDFDKLFQCLSDLKQGKKTEIPVYSFEQHQRLNKTISIYSPHVIVLEGILAIHDPRVIDILDLKVYMEADADLCLSRRIVRDVRERGRTIEGTIKQWFSSVKPAFTKYVEPQRETADLIVPRGMMNKMAITMIVGQTRQILKQKSVQHSADLERLGQQVKDKPLSSFPNIMLLHDKPQIKGICTILHNQFTNAVEFTHYTDRLTALLIEKALDCHHFVPSKISTPVPGAVYSGLKSAGKVSAIIILRGGGVMETGLRRSIPDCATGRMLIQSSMKTGEPELHFLKLFEDIAEHETVLLLDPQMSSGGAALMAVKVLVDYGVKEERIVFVTFLAGKRGVKRLVGVFPEVKVVAAEVGDDGEGRWIEERYFGC